MTILTRRQFLGTSLAAGLTLPDVARSTAGPRPDDVGYFDLVRRYADAMIDQNKGRDHFGEAPSPLVATVLDRRTYQIPEGNVGDLYRARVPQEFKFVANPHMDENLLQVLYALADITGDRRYASEADRTIAYFLNNCQDEKYGFFAWGEHLGWDLRTHKLGGFPESTPKAAIHEFWRPWIYWDKSFELAPAACQRFARALWKYQISHAPPSLSWSRHAQVLSDPPSRRGYEFPRHGGFYIATWAHAYLHTRDSEMLTAIEALVDFFLANRNPRTGAIPHFSQAPIWLRTESNVSLAVHLLEAAPLVPDPLGDKMRALAAQIDDIFLKLKHDPGPGGKGLVLTASTDDLEPMPIRLGDDGVWTTAAPPTDLPLTSLNKYRHKPYTEGWLGAYVGPVPHSTLIGYCIARHRQAPLDGYRKLILLTADSYLASEPDLAPYEEDGKTITPNVDAGTIGRVIGLMNYAYRLTRDEKYLNRAEWFSGWAAENFWPDDQPLPRPTVRDSQNIYSASSRCDTLAMNMLEADLLRRRPGTKVDFRWSDI